MASTFDPRRFLRRTSPTHVQAYAEREGHALPSVAWDGPTSARIEAILADLALLPPAQRDQVEADFQDIDRMACDLGVKAIIEEAARLQRDLGAGFLALENHHDRAFEAFLNHRVLWLASHRLADTDAVIGTRAWHSRADAPCVAPNTSPEACRALATGLTALFRRQLRGRHCQVDHVRRADGQCQFFAYLNDLPQAFEYFDDSGTQIQRQVSQRIFEVTFACPPSGGSIAVYVQGGAPKELREELFAIFAQAILGQVLRPMSPHTTRAHLYQLDHLLRRLELPRDPSSGLANAWIKALWFKVAGFEKRRVMIEADPTRHLDIYDMLADWVNTENVPMTNIRVYKAAFSIAWAGSSRRAPSCTFTVTQPGTCDLKSKPERYRRVGELHLKLWGVDVTGATGRTAPARTAA